MPSFEGEDEDIRKITYNILSIQFNDTNNRKGLVQLFEKEIGANYGDISGNTNKLKEFTADVNIAFDEYVALAIRSSGTWQFDDSNHTDYPIITTNLVSGQRDYTFVTDEGGNIILDIYSVFRKDQNGIYGKIEAVDQQSDDYVSGFWDGQNLTGTPERYDKTANGIFLDAVPSYNSTNGLKVYINREASYFTSTDTTKKPGVTGLHHKWFFLRPALDYARRYLSNDAYTKIQNEVTKLEAEIKASFSLRQKDTQSVLTTETVNSI